MSFLSLEKYLYGQQSAAPPAVESRQACGHLEFVGGILDGLRQSVLAGDAYSDLSAEIEDLRQQLQADPSLESLAGVNERCCAVMQRYRDRLRQADQERAEDFRKILSILNETFAHVSSSADRSNVRLKQLEESLSQAAKLDDMRLLKRHLVEALQNVRQGAEQEKAANETVATLSNQIRSVHQTASRFRVRLPARDEAVDQLRSLLNSGNSNEHSYVALFVAESLQAMRSRHGNETVENLLDELGRKDIQELAPEGKVFCWSAKSLLLTWRSHEDRERVRDIARKLPSPYEYRAFVGNRNATFNVALRSAVILLEGSFDDLICNLDHFERGGAQ